MIRLLYISQAKNVMDEEQIKNILQSSRRNNPSLGITGVLLYGGGLFMQILEGPEKNVLRQYVKILDDPRHEDSIIIYLSPANERMFEQWAMGAIYNNPLDFQHISSLRANRLESVQAIIFKSTMQEFLKKLNAEKE